MQQHHGSDTPTSSRAILLHTNQFSILFLHTTSLFYVDLTIFLFVFLGLITVGLAVITANLDGILQLGNTAMGVLAGPLLAIFLLGFFTTAANKYVRLYIFHVFLLVIR